jgi:uncharacterized membrane protein
MNHDIILFWGVIFSIPFICYRLIYSNSGTHETTGLLWLTNLTLIGCLGIYLYLGRSNAIQSITFVINNPKVMQQLTHELNHPKQLMSHLNRYIKQHPSDKQAIKIRAKLASSLQKKIYN